MKSYLAIIFAIFCLTITYGCSDKCRDGYDEYKIEYYFELKRNNHVGNNWSCNVYYNNTQIKSGDVLKLKRNTDLNIEVEICEYDNHNDIGKTSVILNTENKTSDTAEIIVRERHGRYKGRSATWIIYCNITKI